jgi:hypothetical protein
MFKEIAHMYEHPQGVSKKTYLEKMKQLREALIQDMDVMEKRMSAGFNIPAAGSGMGDAQAPRNPLTEIMMDRESAGKYGSLSDDDLIGMLR